MAISLPLTVKIMVDRRSSDAPYVAYCPELDVASCGPTEEKARSMLWETVDIILEDAHERGTLKDYLSQVGFFEDEKRKMFVVPKVSYEPYYLQVPRYLEKKFVCLA